MKPLTTFDHDITRDLTRVLPTIIADGITQAELLGLIYNPDL